MTEEIAKRFAEKVMGDANNNHFAYGLRAIFSEDGNVPHIGENLDVSYDWSNGKQGEALDGTCAMGFKVDDLMLDLLDDGEKPAALAELTKRIMGAYNEQYAGDVFILVAGNDANMDYDATVDEDCNNSIIVNDAVAIDVVKL